MADAPEVIQDNSTLEAVEHNPDVSPLSPQTAKFANNTTVHHSPEAFNTYWQNHPEEKAKAAAAASPSPPKKNFRHLRRHTTIRMRPRKLLLMPVGTLQVPKKTGRGANCGSGWCRWEQIKKERASGSRATRIFEWRGSRNSYTHNRPFAKFYNCPPSSTIDEAKWPPVEFPGGRYYHLEMGADAVATFYYLGYVGSQKDINGSEIGSEPEWQAQAGGVPVMNNKLWQFENAKDASKYDSISPYLRDNEPSMVYWLSNKVASGYALGFDKEEFAAYKERLGDNFTSSDNEFPIKFVPIDHRDNSQMWRFTQVNQHQ